MKPFFLLLSLMVSTAIADDGLVTSRAFRYRAPGFTGARAWLQTPRPITLEQLRGKVVLLDFWTYCCINCMHVIPDLAYLEDKYRGQPFVVIGIHSAKFTNEAETASIRQAMLRYDIRHPVAVDSDYKIWGAYGVQAWPTLMLIDSEGNIAGTASGEGERDRLDQAITQLLAEGRARNTLNTKPFEASTEIDQEDQPLRFPGKVLATGDGKLFVADSGHHRIILATLDGKVTGIVGRGSPGWKDGPGAEAEFRNPQGLAYDGKLLYVADTGNHLVRRIDLASLTVDTIAGTGKQARPVDPEGPARTVALNSPWDLAIRGETLFVAEAGSHQIWTLDLHTGKAAPFIGSGREDIRDGTGERSSLAQPSGLSLAGESLYVADSEVSAVRRITLTDPPRIETLVGKGLFEFGDVTGSFGKARLQHPLGVAAATGTVYVADTYNHRVRALDLLKHEVSNVWGMGKPGSSPQELNEPGGISLSKGILYVADTNNHRIIRHDLATGKTSVLLLPELTPPEIGDAAPTIVRTAPQRIGAHTTLIVNFDVEAPLHVNPKSPRHLRVGDRAIKLPPGGAPANIAVKAGDVKKGLLILEADYFVCEDRPGALCTRRLVRFELPVVDKGAKVNQVSLRTPVQ